MNDATQLLSENSSDGEVGIVRHHDFRSDEEFRFECGETIPSFQLRYETYGNLNKDHSNAILVCHALSGDHHCAGVYSLQDRKPGWWNQMIGPGKPIDTNRFFVICSNCIGGCQGSTGPTSINPETGSPYRLSFPLPTIRDMVAAQARLIDFLEIERLACVIGGSMGGMQTLQWAIDFPDRVESILALATTPRQNDQAIAFNAVGRTAILQDPGWQNGEFTSGAGPDVGLSVARMMAHITYVSDEGLEQKFGRARRLLNPEQTLEEIEFEVESYLRYQGQVFVSRFDPITYIYFTKALDRFDLYGKSGSLEDAFANVTARALVIGFTSDWLFPPEQNRRIATALLRAGKNASYAEVDMKFGHDSFLLDSPELSRFIRNFLINR
ncbi:homoserine O-acetyltransferase MetX [Puniceicoccus vermicola]|uniref:Homoserine O-acetyltransferase n=1 Tax=Puniceicoccus vermicola TaxID=388746 RepID=A0A7X1AZX3_9BACT|nr:homoserine O-acetyltransferase [Puniceicoccus vermicola]MBC2603071.1 homoserine O-acetyltransferase [Puniceicoccus vermicola]